MSINQGLRQAAFRATAGTTGTYNGDFLASAATQGFTGEFNGVFIQWLQNRTGSSETNIDNLKQEFAELVGAHNWESVGFVPPLLVGNQLWLDGADTETITDVNENVSRWDGKSGQGNNALQGVEANQPATESSTLNNRNVITFDGVDDLLTVAADASIDNLFDGGGTVFVVFNPTSDGENDLGRIVDKGGNLIIFLNAEAGGVCDIRFLVARATANGDWRPTTKAINIGVGNIFAVTYDSSSVSNDPTIYLDGASVAVAEVSMPVGDVTDDSGDDLDIGNRSSDTARSYDGDIAELLMYDHILSAAEIAVVHTDLSSKYGI